MQTRRFKDLGIVSAKKPFNSHLWWEHATYGLILVDSGDQTKLFISIDKGDNWVEIDLSDNTNSYKIQSGFLDGNDLWLVMCDNDGTADDFEVCFVELDDSNDCNPIGVLGGGVANSYYAYDIWVYDGDTYASVRWDAVAGFPQHHIVDVDTAPLTSKDHLTDGSGLTEYEHATFGIIVGDDYFYFVYNNNGDALFLNKYDHSATDLTQHNFIAGYFLPGREQQSIAYDGSNLLYFIGNKVADGKDYLITYSISGNSFTVHSEYDIVLMLDRNNAGTAPNEFEKGFSIGASETVYEIKARRGGIRILQDCSGISDAVLIAITDNFLMNNDGDMFEFTDVSNEIASIRYNDGIIGILKKGMFNAHPDFHINWSKKDSIKIYDDNDVLEFHGIITDKSRNSRGIYFFKIDSFTNEIYRKTYNKTYSADDTDTKQKDIIDNACDFCYRSSSIVGTTTPYDYVYNRAISYQFWLARFLERQVPYVESDGKIFTKAYDGLVATGKSWDINDNNQDVVLTDIPGLAERLQGFFDGNSGVTRNTVRYKNNASVTRPVAATRDPIEQLQGVLPLEEFRDPKIEAATEANQLGDNRYNIWSIDTIFLGLKIRGEGYLQPGKTIQIQNTGEITITQDDFLILSFERDPKNDVYTRMILSDNIIFPSEFKNLQNTTITQVHTASIQAIENQAIVSLIGESADDNLRIGSGALASLTTGDRDIAIGKNALTNCTSGSNHVAIGAEALYTITTTHANVAIGRRALYAATGGNNVAIGYEALRKNTTGSNNFALGYQTLYDNLGGVRNVGIGYNALANNTSANHNVGIGGYRPLYQVTTGGLNVGIGSQTLYTLTTGTNNMALGYQAGYSTTGTGNIYIGYQAGFNHDGSDKLFIDNSDTATPLIWGDFANNIIDINGTFKINAVDIEAFLGIGIANKRWKNCIFRSGLNDRYTNVATGEANVDANNMTLTYSIPLPYIVGGKNLVITQTRIGVYAADVDDFITHVYGRGWADETGPANVWDDGSNRALQGEYDYDHADVTVGGNYTLFEIYMVCSNTDPNHLQIGYVQVEYYYA